MQDSEWEDSEHGASSESNPNALIQASVRAGEALAYEASVSIIQRAEYGLLDQDARARQDQRVQRRLVEAGEGLLAALEAVAHDENLWGRLAASERHAAAMGPLSFEQDIQIREILAYNIPTMLRQFGYSTPPPPPAERWVKWMQEPLEDLMSDGQGDPNVSRRAASAQRHMHFFVYRFRRLLMEARAQLDVQPGSQEPQGAPIMRRLLAAGVTAARERAVPAALAAGAAAAVVAGPLGGAAGAAGGAGSAILGDVSKEFVKVIVEALAVTGLARVQSQPQPNLSPEERLGESFTLLDEASHALRTGEGHPSEAWNRWAFIAQRSMYDLLQELPHPALQAYAIDMLREFTDALQNGDPELLEQVIYHLKHSTRAHGHW